MQRAVARRMVSPPNLPFRKLVEIPRTHTRGDFIYLPWALRAPRRTPAMIIRSRSEADALGASKLRIGPEQRRFTRRMRHQPTPAECVLWQRLRGKQTGFKFARQRTILKYVVDFYCMSAGLAVEVDGGYHSSQIDYDQRRDMQLGELGVVVLRFTKHIAVRRTWTHID